MHDLLTRIVSPMGGPNLETLSRAVARKVVLVTGASFGIGEASARKLGAAGATVVLLARSAERLETLAHEIRSRGGVAHAYPVDLSDTNAVAATARAILAEHGHVDVVVNNAGKSIRRSLALSYDRFHDVRRTADVNYLGPVQLLLALLPSMRARKQGHIVNVSTVGARVPPGPRWGAYQASKSAFDVWLRSAAAEVRGDGVTVSSIYMSLVHTRMSAPTKGFRYLPGLAPEQAADLVCRAIAMRPPIIAPWWVAPAELAGNVFRRPIERALAATFRFTRDTVSARGGRPAELEQPLSIGWEAVRAMAKAGVLTPKSPARAPAMLAALRFGASPAMACALAAARDPESVAIADEGGTETFAELCARSRALASALHATYGVGKERGLAVMCRNHRGFVEAALAASWLGADLVLVNTEFPGPELSHALTHHRFGAAIFDAEFATRFSEARYAGPRIVAWHDGAAHDDVTLDALVANAKGAPPRPTRQGRFVILTSGTTGAPKAAPRVPSAAALAGPIATILSKLGLRSKDPIYVAPPLFHGFGFAYLGLALVLGSPLVLRRRFDAEAMLGAIEAHRAAVVLAVPVMLDRLLALPDETRARYDTSSLRAVLSGGAPLSPTLALRFMDVFGDLLFNLYGSTETGFGAIAEPADLRAAPGTVGRPPLGTTLKILDAHRAEVAPSATGSVFVGGPLAFGGYAGGGSKESVRGMLNTGDLGHMDEFGRLFIVGRQDDMIVSGGENVFPAEIEAVLSSHPDVADVAVLGVSDADYGQRLRAFVVPRAGATLSEDDVRGWVKRHVARYKVPRDVVFLDALPRNATGKVVRAKLAQQATS
jgi:acyl-CoA synthetase (AMP-forming)/AMP-acid ligase II/NAD(P)-dependent dehydrogenase (short-subunit alcohol dehydrogenase family)